MREIRHGELAAELGGSAHVDVHGEICHGRCCGPCIRVGGGGDRQCECCCGGIDLAVFVERNGAQGDGRHGRNCRRVIELVVDRPFVGVGCLHEVQVHRRGHALGVVHIDRRAVSGARRGGNGRRGGRVARRILGARVQVQCGLDRFGLLGLDGGSRWEAQGLCLRGAEARGGVHPESHHLGTAVGDQITRLVELEIAGTRVCGRAIGLLHLEKAVAVDGHIQVVARHGDVALRELLGHRRHFDADAIVGATARSHGRCHQVRELGARRLETRGVGIGDVVTNDVQVLAGGVQSREAVLESHGVYSW